MTGRIDSTRGNRFAKNEFARHLAHQVSLGFHRFAILTEHIHAFAGRR